MPPNEHIFIPLPHPTPDLFPEAAQRKAPLDIFKELNIPETSLGSYQLQNVKYSHTSACPLPRGTDNNFLCLTFQYSPANPTHGTRVPLDHSLPLS